MDVCDGMTVMTDGNKCTRGLKVDVCVCVCVCVCVRACVRVRKCVRERQNVSLHSA